MTQPSEAVGGSGEPIIAAEPTVEERFAALDKQDEEEDGGDEGELPPLEAETDEPELEAEDDGEEADEPPIAAPVSWTAEEKEEFKNLPRSMQETLTRRETERERFVQSKSQEAAQNRLIVAQQAAAQVQQAQQQNLQILQAMLPEIPNEPSAYLQAQDPYAYANALEARKLAIAQHEYVQQVAQMAAQTRAEDEQAITAEQARLSHEMLATQFPEYLDQEKGPELRKSLQSTALALGYTMDQLAHSDAQDVLAIRKANDWKVKAEKYDALMSRQMQGVRNAKTLPKVSRPGVPQGKGVVANQRYQADRKAMMGGDKDAAARVFSKFI